MRVSRPVRAGRAIAALALLLGAASPAHAQSAVPPSVRVPAADSAAIVAVVRRYIAAMAARDTAYLRAGALPTFASVGIAEPGGTVGARGLDEFVAAMGREPRRFEGWIWSAAVTIDGPIALLTAPYLVHFDGRPSHCGTDHYVLAHAGERWLVSQVLYTRRTEGCPPPP